MAEKQNQKAGNDALQVQVSGDVHIHGIDEKRAREIYMELFASHRKELTLDAFGLASERVQKLEDLLIHRMAKVDGALEAFADPGFQLALTSAHKAAAGTERQEDYELLSELLVHRVAKGEDRYVRAGISQAIRIVGEISSEALLGLTVKYFLNSFSSTEGNLFNGLETLERILTNLVYDKLPQGRDWVDHLDTLNVVRISSVSHFKKFELFLSEVYSGWIAVGIEKDSSCYLEAIKILQSVGLSVGKLLMPHELRDGYVRIPVAWKGNINMLMNPTGIIVADEGLFLQQQRLTPAQISALEAVYDLYDKNSVILAENTSRFFKELEKRPILKMVSEWRDVIPSAFTITPIGKVLAHANAERCDKTIPPFNKS